MNKEYKGYFYGNDDEKQYYEGGAHFSYQHLVIKLLKLQKSQKLKQQSQTLTSINNDNYERSKRYTKCKKIILDNSVPFKFDLNNKNIQIIQNEQHNKENKIDNNTYLIVHKKSQSFSKTILNSRNRFNKNTINQQIKPNQQTLKLTLTKQKSTDDQNKNNVHKLIINDNVLPKLNLKYSFKDNHLGVNLFNKANTSSRTRNTIHNHKNSRNAGLNSLKFFSIDDKHFNNVMKGYQNNVPITERKHSINKTNDNETYKLNLKEFKVY